MLHNDVVVYRRRFGLLAIKPEVEQMPPLGKPVLYDLASLTKCVATAPSIMLLIEAGRIKLDDPVAKYLPAFAANGKDKITIENLLLHTSGLIADNPLSDFADGPAKAIERIMAINPLIAPGRNSPIAT